MTDENSLTARDRLAKLDLILDEYETKVGLPQYSYEFSQSDEIEKLTTLTRDAMEKMHPEDCVESAVILNSFSFHLQRSINRELSRVSWADSTLKKLVTPRIPNYKGSGSYGQIFDLAILDDDYTKKVLEIKIYAQQRADRLSFLANGIKSIADDLKNLSAAKRSKHNG